MNKKSFDRFLQLLSHEQKRKGLLITLLLAFNSFLDFVSIASFLPLIVLVVNPSYVATNSLISSVYNFWNFESYQSFIIVITSGIVCLVILKNLISLWIAKAKAKYAFMLGSELSTRALDRYLQLNYHEFIQIDHTREMNRIANQPFCICQ